MNKRNQRTHFQVAFVGFEVRIHVDRRRIEACMSLGWTDITAVIARNVDEAVKYLEAERDENTCRKDFTPSEAVSIGQAVIDAFGPENLKKQRAGTSEGGAAGGRGKKKNPSKTFTKVSKQDNSKRTNAKAAKAVGMSHVTYKKASAVVASGDKKLIAEMDRTGKVNGAHKKLKKEAAKKGGRTAGRGRPSDRGSKTFTKPKQDNSKRTASRQAVAARGGKGIWQGW